MDNEIKNNLNRITRDAETGVARAILRWRYKKEGKPAPGEDRLAAEARQIAGRAHEIIGTRGRSVWNEFKKLRKDRGGRGGESGEG
jgi:hypothetical protein